MNSQVRPASSQGGATDPAFAFVQELAGELSKGKLDLPSFPDIAVRVRQVLSDGEVAPDKVVKVVGSEPALAARLMRVANSSAMNPTGRPVTDLRAAITRLGFNVVRSAAIAFAVSQMKHAEDLKGLEKPLNELWSRSALVAATCFVTARRSRRVSAEEALLCGLLHGIGRLYILSRMKRHPLLFADQEAYAAIVASWHAEIAKAVLENWQMSEALISAVQEQENPEHEAESGADLADVLIASNILATMQDTPDSALLALKGVRSAVRLQLDEAAVKSILHDSRDQIDALRAALGQ